MVQLPCKRLAPVVEPWDKKFGQGKRKSHHHGEFGFVGGMEGNRSCYRSAKTEENRRDLVKIMHEKLKRPKSVFVLSEKTKMRSPNHSKIVKSPKMTSSLTKRVDEKVASQRQNGGRKEKKYRVLIKFIEFIKCSL